MFPLKCVKEHFLLRNDKTTVQKLDKTNKTPTADSKHILCLCTNLKLYGELLRPLQQDQANTSRWHWERENMRLNQGESQRPLCNLWVSMPSYIPMAVVRGHRQHIADKHTPCAHIAAVLRQRHASRVALPSTKQEGEDKKKHRVWINSLPIYGLEEVLRLHSSKKCVFSSFRSTVEHSERISTS